MKFTNGMQPDPNLYGFVDGSWLMAKNIRRVNGIIEVDYGTIDVTTLGGEVVGVCNTGKYLYIITSEETAGRDRILKFDGTSVELILYCNLDLIPNRELKVVYKYNHKDEVILAWVDGVNPLRVLNVDNLPFKSGIDNTYKTPLNDNNLGLTKVKPICKFPSISLIQSQSGILPAGVYQTAIRYKYKDIQTDWSILSNRVVILGDSDVYMVSPNPHTNDRSFNNAVNYVPYLKSENSNRGLYVKLENLDPSYDTIDIAVIKSISTGGYEGTANVITNILISNTAFLEVYIYGIYDTYIDLEEVLQINASILKPKSICNFRDKLLVGSYESIIDYDEDLSQLNNLTLTWTIKNENATKVPTFQWGEVYAFYAAYYYNDGSIGNFTYIKGRDFDTNANPLENSDLGIEPDQFKHIQPNMKYYQLYDTTNIKSETLDEVIGEFGVWENENELYPNSDEHVRHHRFPFRKSILDGTSENWTERMLLFATLGVIVDISTLTLPANVVGVVISYAKRDLTSALVQDSAICYDLLDYNKGAAVMSPLLIENRNAPKYPYLYHVVNHAHVIPVAGINNLITQGLEFKIEDNDIDNNNFSPDMLYSDSNLPSLNGSTVYVMNDLRDLYVPTFGRELVTLGVIYENETGTFYDGDVYTSYYTTAIYYEYDHSSWHSVFLQGIITSPIIQDLQELTMLPLYAEYGADEFEKGVQTLSVNRFQTRLRGIPQLPINKPNVLIKDTSKLISVFSKDIIMSDLLTYEYENWTFFSPISTYTIPSLNEYIYDLTPYGNALYIRTDRTLYVAKIRDTFDMQNGAVGLKSGDLFDQIPQELLPTSHGIMNGNSKLATYLTKVGLIIVDVTTASIFILGEQMVDLTITNKEYFKQVFKGATDTHLSSLSGVSVCFEAEYNRLFVTINTTVVTFDIMSKQLISTFEIEPNYMFSLLGDNQPFYIHGNRTEGFKIGKLSNRTFPTESYIELAIASDELPSFGINSLKWITVGGVSNTIEGVSIWTDISATGLIDVSRADVASIDHNNVIQGNTTFDVDGVFKFNDIFDNVINQAVDIFNSSDKYNVELNTSNINTSKRDTDLFGTHMRIRLYLRLGSTGKVNRNCKLKSIDLCIKPYTSKFD